MTTPKIIPLLLIVFSIGVSACEREEIQSVAPEGEFTFGTARNDIICDAILLQDGNYMLLGGAQQEDNLMYDPWLLKLDPEGNEIWQKYLPFDNRNVYGRYIIDIGGNEYLMLAIAEDLNYGAGQYYFIWLDQSFNISRQITMPVETYQYDVMEHLSGIHDLAENGFGIPIQNYDNLTISRSDRNGNPAGAIVVNDFLPFESYSGDRRDYFRATPQGGYLYIREYPLNSEFNYEVNYLDSNFQIVSSQNYPFDGYGFQLNATGFLPDSSLVLAFSETYSPLCRLQHIAADGTHLGEYIDPSTPVRFIKSLPNGNVALFAGFSSINSRPYQLNGNGDYRVIERNSDWDTVREIEFGGDQHERLMQVVEGSDGRFKMCGFTESYGAGGLDAYVTFFKP